MLWGYSILDNNNESKMLPFFNFESSGPSPSFRYGPDPKLEPRKA